MVFRSFATFLFLVQDKYQSTCIQHYGIFMSSVKVLTNEP